MKKIYTLLICSFVSLSTFAQMWNGQDTLYGNEWIDYSKTYYKIPVAQDGIVRLPVQTLIDANIPVSDINGDQFKLYHMGKEVPLYTTTNSNFSDSDYIEFFGQKNRSELDSFFYQNPDEDMLNPYYSLYTDTSSYYLSWTEDATMRYSSISNDLDNLPEKEAFFMDEVEVLWKNNFITKRDANNVSLSNYDEAEGFASPLSITRTSNLKPKSIFGEGPESTITIRYTGELGPHKQQVFIEDNLVDEIESNGFKVIERSYEVSTDIIDGTTSVKLQGTADNTDKQSISRVHLQYPRLFNFNNVKSFIFKIEASSTKKYLEIDNFNAGGTEPILYDLTNQTRLETNFSAGIIQAVLPPSSEERKLILVNTLTGINIVSSITPSNFIDYKQQEGDFVIISNKALFSDEQGVNQVQQYVDYRASTEGGQFNPTVIDIEQLYDQFSYGVHRHPISIRNFSHYIDKTWETDIRYAFIIGKGREYRDTRTTSELEGSINQTLFVPTFGYPGADNLMFSDNSSSAPIFAVGRIPASKPSEIATYLEKVIQHEQNILLPQTIEDRSWMKRILHLSGGDVSIQNAIAGYLTSMENIIENNSFGADVTTFYKNSSDPIQISQTEEIFDLINNGVSIITFFGHSAVGTFDFNIDNPDNYNNYQKYPLFISLGCYSGNIHTSLQGVSERFTFYEDKGAIAFAASTGVGYTTSLRTFAQQYYTRIGETMYGQGIGDVLKSTIEHFDATSSFGITQLNQQFTINGDPALRLNPLPGPDFIIDPSSLSFDPKVINAQLDSFDLNVTLKNIGRNVNDSLSIKVEQTFPDGSMITSKVIRLQSPSFEKELTIKLPTFGKSAIGQNTITFTVDDNNEIEERPSLTAESNNSFSTSFFVIDDNAQTIFPKEFSIINRQNFSLIASTLDPMSAEKRYVFELDTTENFNSSLLVRHELNQSGGLLKWNPNTTFRNNTVYYWRVSPDSTSAEIGYVWSNSSFIYIDESSPGWNQSHYYQYQKDDLENMSLTPERDFKFIDDFRDIRIVNKVWEGTSPPEYFNNTQSFGSPWKWSIQSGLQVIVMDSITLNYWRNEAGSNAYGSISHASSTMIAFPYKTNSFENREQLLNFLENDIPSGNYVIVYSVLRNFNQDMMPETWAQDSITSGRNIFSVLEAQGATKIRDMETLGTVPYVFMYQKDRGFLSEGIGQDMNSTIQVQHAFPGSWTEGKINSTRIGPASEWSTLEWQIKDVASPENDTISITVIGIDENQQNTTLFDGVTDFNLDLSSIDANQYPYIELELNSKDELDRTSGQLDYWRVLYNGIPEAAVNPNALFSINKDTLQRGEDLTINYRIENISDYDMDSLLIKYTLRSNTNEEVISYDRIRPLDKQSSINADKVIPTKNLSAGNQAIVIEVNPDEDQIEELHINNFITANVLIDSDKENPNLDVTFDGVHIMNGDIVSSKPNIYITLKDENPYLELNDTSLFRLFLTYPDGRYENIPFDRADVQFFPAQSPGDQAIVEFNPVLELDGAYELFVQAEDVTGNQSGDLDYKVQFEVVTRKTISNVLNYPNPFSTATQFVYTLTGDSPPDFFKIQIMTVSGKIVKEITQDEIGLLKVGTHRTEYTWDGTDDYGDRLANGVYLYRIVAKQADGSDYEKYDTGTSIYFKEGFSKMVIMR